MVDLFSLANLLRAILYFCFGFRNTVSNLNSAEHIFLDREIGSLSPSHAPNVAGRELFWFGLRVVGILAKFLLTSRPPKESCILSRICLRPVLRKRLRFVHIPQYNSPVEEVG